MTSRQQWAAVVAIVGVLATGVWIGSQLLGEETYDVRVGKEAPGFNAVDVASSDGTLRTLSDYRGKVVLLNVWATWCGPCKQEMPSMERLHQAYRKQGLSVVAVSVDAHDMEPAIRQFADNYQLTFDILYDRSEIFRTVYSYNAVPETYIIDRGGIIRRRWLGADDWNSEANRRFIEQLLAESGS
jgi:cytochrome c biogenesis protein CcmG, thiol:disulfide interchange protein DsbE